MLDDDDYSDQSFDENEMEEETANAVLWSDIEANNRYGQTRNIFNIAGKMKREHLWGIEELLERFTGGPSLF